MKIVGYNKHVDDELLSHYLTPEDGGYGITADSSRSAQFQNEKTLLDVMCLRALSIAEEFSTDGVRRTLFVRDV